MSALTVVECECGIPAFAMCKDARRGQKRSLCGEWGQDISTKWDDVELGYQHPHCECVGAGYISTHNVGCCQ